MKATGRNISKAIKRETGYDVKLYKSDGCFHFYSDDEQTSLMLAGLYTTTVLTYLLTNLSVDEWVREFKGILNEDGATNIYQQPL